MDDITRGFILQAFQNTTHGPNGAVFITGKLEDGGTFGIIETRQAPQLYVRASDADAAQKILGQSGGRSFQTILRTMDGSPAVGIRIASEAGRRKLAARFRESGIRTYEADISRSRRLLIDRKIRSAVGIRGAWQPGSRVDRLYTDPEIFPAEWKGGLSVLSFDIETDIHTGTVLAVSLAKEPSHTGAGGKDVRSREVLMHRENFHSESAAIPIRIFDSEKALLKAFIDRVTALDPDIITGWNVLEFDLPVLQARCRLHGIPFLIGRSPLESDFSDTSGRDSRPAIVGRQVLDGMWLARMALKGMEDYRLETVAETVLGRTKLITAEEAPDRGEEVIRLYRSDPGRLAEYCLRDAELVLDILEKERLLELTIQKSLLIGLPPEFAWKSVVSFEFLYMQELHARGYIAPTRGVDQIPITPSPGGGIITPMPGLFDNVLVFDFKSLYPSLMRTFNIDPLAHQLAEYPSDGGARIRRENLITAPNGAAFIREPGILPALLDSFSARREEAKRDNNATASYAYKIIQNSFYGVLGTEGCRFASPRLAGAITSFGQFILFWTRDYLENRGYRILYGDTDSVFLLSGLSAGCSSQEACEAGEKLAAGINEAIRAYFRERWQVDSVLEIEFEKYYRKFFLPPVRNAGTGENGESRGRAKGYAGFSVRPGKPGEEEHSRIEITGMEAVRHDWTALARGFQRKLLGMAFTGVSEEELRGYIGRTVKEVREGAHDRQLVYRKALGKPIGAYTKSQPPHVRAAALLPSAEQRGTIAYVQTVEGPQPERNRNAALDYAHYIEKQLKPIAGTIAPYLGMDFSDIFSPDKQLELF